MVTPDDLDADMERRAEERSHSEIFVNIRPLDDQNDYPDAIIADISSIGATLISPIPLPIGLRIAIHLDGFNPAMAEVVDWEWDYRGDMARLGLKFIEKGNNWPSCLCKIYDRKNN